VRHRALREEDRINGRAGHGRPRHTAPRHALRQAKKARQREGRDQKHRRARRLDVKPEGLPRERDEGRDERRVRVRERGRGHEVALEKNVVRGGDEVAGLVPVVRQGEQREVRDEERGEKAGRQQRVEC
jgi:hypothetical protein